jgi:O-antigen/teichoic acid export membrane protein
VTRHPSGARIVLNVLSNWAGQAVSLALSFFVAPFVVRSLGNSEYGIWMLMVAISGYLSLLDLGVRAAVTRYLARFAAEGDHASASRMASASLRIFAAMGVVGIAASLVLALFVLDRFGVPEHDLGTARLLLILVGVNVAVSLVSGVYGGAVAALQRFDLLNVAEVATALVRTGATVLALFAGQGVLAMGAIQLATSVWRGVWLASLGRQLYPSLRIDFRHVDYTSLKLIFSFSSLTFLIHISARLIYYTDALVIAAFLPIGVLTFFSIAGSLVEYARMIISSVSFTTSPMASSLEGAGEHERVRLLLLTSAKYSMMILLPVALTFLLRGRSFIGLWMGPSFADMSGLVLAILSLPLLFHGSTHAMGGIMIGVGKHKPMVPAMIVEAGANLALSIALLPRLGIVGVAWGTTIPSLASSLFFWPYYTRRALGIPVVTYFQSVWMRPWTAAVPFALASSAMERWWPATNLLTFFVQIGMCLLLAIAADWKICLSAEERDAILRSARRRISGLPVPTR